MAKKETTKKNKTDKRNNNAVEKIEEVITTEPVETEEVIEENKTELSSEDVYKELAIPVEVNEKTKDSVLNELIIMNEEEMVEKAKEYTKIDKKENNKTIQKVDNIFGYLWNGQEIDF